MALHFSHLLFWLGLSAAAVTVYLSCVVIYRLFFHPLAKYPGPVWAKISDLYMLYHAWKGDRHLEFWRLHERYGKIVRYGPNKVSFNSATALKDIYGFKANVRKADFYDAFAHPVHNTHNTRDKTEHARKRRVLSHAFSDSAIKEVERYVLANIRTFCQQIGDMSNNNNGVERKGWSTPKNMTDWCNYLAMDILGDLAYGKAFHMLEKPDNRYAIDMVGMAAQRHLMCGTMPIIDQLGLDKYLFHKIAAGRARFMVYSRGQLTERTRVGDDTDRRDFFYHLLKARDPETGEGFKTPELWAESNLLIIAGSDTTSTAMAATFFYLVRNPAALAAATAEVRDTFASVEDIRTGAALSGCTYLRACIDEAQRLSPSVGGLLPREVLAGGLVVDGEMVPPGTVVGTPHYALHHHPAYFANPFAYVPERWIVGATRPGPALLAEKRGGGSENGGVTTEADVARAQSAFSQFSIGPRGCIGKGLAYVEMTTTLARTLFLYDIRQAAAGWNGEEHLGAGRAGAEWGRHRPGEFQLRDIFTSLKDGPMVEFRARA